jgi:mitogen-activated protein kinase kinase
MLTVANGLSTSAPPTASASKTYHSALSEKLANFGEDLKNEDLKDIQELGQGNGGSVKKVEHTPTGTIMAKKVRFVLSFARVHPLLLPPLPYVFRHMSTPREC